MPFRLTRQAYDDLFEFTIYGIETFGQAQARKYHEALVRTFELLADMPNIGREVPELGDRLQRFEYGRHSIFYIARADHVEIGRIIDNRRDMRRHFRTTEGGG